MARRNRSTVRRPQRAKYISPKMIVAQIIDDMMSALEYGARDR